MTGQLTEAEIRRVTHCDECGYDWQQHTSSKGAAWNCPCNSAEQVLIQVAALLTEREALALHALADKWQFGAWTEVLPKSGARTIAKAEAVTSWLRAQADERGAAQ